MSDQNSVPESVMGEFLAECDEILQRVSSALPQLEKENYAPDVIDSIYRDIHTLKGSA